MGEETRASSSTRYGSLFGNAENRRRMFKTKKKSLLVTTRLSSESTTEKTTAAEDKKRGQETPKETIKLPAGSHYILNSEKDIKEEKITEYSVTDKKDTKYKIEEVTNRTPLEPKTTEKKS